MNQASDHSRSTIIIQALHSALGLFKVRREERRLAWGALLYALVLNTMIVCRYWEWFSQVTDGYRKLVLRHFHISGFDPITYLVLNDWSAAYNIYRHPLLAFFMWIPAQVNRLIILATGGQLRAGPHGPVARRRHLLRRPLPFSHPARDRRTGHGRRPAAHPSLSLLRLHDGVAQRSRPLRPLYDGPDPHPLRRGP